jgi:hypothetical protein
MASTLSSSPVVCSKTAVRSDLPVSAHPPRYKTLGSTVQCQRPKTLFVRPVCLPADAMLRNYVRRYCNVRKYRVVGLSIFYSVHVLRKESWRLVLLRTYCYFLRVCDVCPVLPLSWFVKVYFFSILDIEVKS